MSAEATRAAYIARVVSEAPPIPDDVLDHIAVLLRPDMPRSSEPSAGELERLRKIQERADALKAARNAALSLTACDVCDLQPDVHDFQRGHGLGFHEWQPGRADKVIAATKQQAA